MVDQQRWNAVIHDVLACGCTLEAVDGEFVDVGDAVTFKGELFSVVRVHTASGGEVVLRNTKGTTVAGMDEVEYVGKDLLSGLKKARKLVPGSTVRHRTLNLVGTVSHKSKDKWLVVVWDSAEKRSKRFKWSAEDVEVLAVGESPLSEDAWGPKMRPSSSSREHRTSLGRVSQPKKKAKSPTISTADLIKEEVSGLRKEEEVDDVMTSILKKKEKKSSVDLESVDKVKPKKRKGTW